MYTSPAKLGKRDQPFDAAERDECPEFLEGGDCAADRHPFPERLLHGFFLPLLLFFQDCPVRHHDVAPLFGIVGDAE